MNQQLLRTRRDYGECDSEIVNCEKISRCRKNSRTVSNKVIDELNSKIAKKIEEDSHLNTINRIARTNCLGNWDEINQYRVGDMVNYSLSYGDKIYGMITKIDKQSDKVEVFWISGLVSQHDSDDISLMPYVDDVVRERFKELAKEYIKEN